MLLEHATQAVDGGHAAVPRPRLSHERLGTSLRSVRPAWMGRYRGARIGLVVVASVAAGFSVVSAGGEQAPRAVFGWATWTVVVVWPLLLGAIGARSDRVFGTGSEEFQRIAGAGLVLLAAAGFFSY